MDLLMGMSLLKGSSRDNDYDVMIEPLKVRHNVTNS